MAEGDDGKIIEALLAEHSSIAKAQDTIVRRICEQIGYGFVINSAVRGWARTPGAWGAAPVEDGMRHATHWLQLLVSELRRTHKIEVQAECYELDLTAAREEARQAHAKAARLQAAYEERGQALIDEEARVRDLEREAKEQNEYAFGVMRAAEDRAAASEAACESLRTEAWQLTNAKWVAQQACESLRAALREAREHIEGSRPPNPHGRPGEDPRLAITQRIDAALAAQPAAPAPRDTALRAFSDVARIALGLREMGNYTDKQCVDTIGHGLTILIAQPAAPAPRDAALLSWETLQEDGWQESHDSEHESYYWRGDHEEPTAWVESDERVEIVQVGGDVDAAQLAGVLAHHLGRPAPTIAAQPPSAEPPATAAPDQAVASGPGWKQSRSTRMEEHSARMRATAAPEPNSLTPRDPAPVERDAKSVKQRVHAAAVELFGEDIGCSDHGCVFGHPGGMGTNGGCQHLKEREYAPLRRMVQQLAAVARRLAEHTAPRTAPVEGEPTEAELHLPPGWLDDGRFDDDGDEGQVYRRKNGDGYVDTAVYVADNKWCHVDDPHDDVTAVELLAVLSYHLGRHPPASATSRASSSIFATCRDPMAALANVSGALHDCFPDLEVPDDPMFYGQALRTACASKDKR